MATAPAVEPPPCALSAAAFSSALHAGSGLPHLTWLSHWQQQEALRQARRMVIDATRGRQQQRQRQVATLMASGDAFDGDCSAGLPASSPAGRLAPAGEPSGGAQGAASCGNELSVSDPLCGSGGSLDLPPLQVQHMSELDDLTWLASHPPEEEEAGAASGGGGGGGSGNGMSLWSHQRQRPPPQPSLQQQQQQQQRQGPAAAGLAGDAGPASAAALQGPVQLRVGNDVLDVRPLWISVYQPEEGGPAK